MIYDYNYLFVYRIWQIIYIYIILILVKNTKNIKNIYIYVFSLFLDET